MEDFNKEKILVNYPLPVTLENTRTILKQMEKCICKIITKNGKGTGFFCKIPYEENKIIPVLITVNHLLNESTLNENELINITLNDDNKDINIKINDNRLIYTSKKYDTTIIEIKPTDDIKDFLELDKDIFKDVPNIFDESVYIIHYPKFGNEQKLAVSYGILNDINEYNIIHYCCTEKGSSGSPIIKISNNKIIGIHKESSKNFNFNKGSFLKFPINEFIKEKMKNLKIDKSEIYSCIPCLNNQKDISYESLKNEIEKTIIKIDKKLKNNFLYNNKTYISEFNNLKNFIDLDKEHLNNLNYEYTEKSRYNSIRPYKHNSIEINTKSKYINASPINIFKEKYLIATQGPLYNTIEDFWTMVEQYQCNAIIMLTNLEENGVQKCSCYWDTNLKMANYKLELILKENIEKLSINITKLKLINNLSKRVQIITHFHFLDWPDLGIPNNNKFYDAFEYLINEAENLKGDYPVIINCGGGVGRTGTFIAIYCLYKEIMNQIKDDNLSIIKFSVFNMVRKIKEMRLFSVETKEQYKIIYEFINLILKKYKAI